MKLTITPAELRQLAFRPTVEESDGTNGTMQLMIDGRLVGVQWPIIRGSVTRFPIPNELFEMTMASRLEIRVS